MDTQTKRKKQKRKIDIIFVQQEKKRKVDFAVTKACPLCQPTKFVFSKQKRKHLTSRKVGP